VVHSEDPNARDVCPTEPSPRPRASVGVPHRWDQTHSILVSSFALNQIKSHSLKFRCTNNPSDLDSTTHLESVPAGPACGHDDGPHDVRRDTDRDTEDGGREPVVDAHSKLPR
jgi:hypothetical protein